ncbi:hypothetical protein MSG28_009987 [Choristoneura fumiferana]|uniref:Uncharacterized protein n=1 Tax=Choristoneura fumiferana TaxID=7141 RepID=A0ACC0JDI2_CHOFU|nr:hypothetical protein MSG28_009987 [Choristoneura fumiferana]
MVNEIQLEDEAMVPNKPVDLDTILTQELGQFGRYQILTLLLTSLPIIFASFASVEYIFTTGRIPTRCLIPECDGPTPEFSPPWKPNAIPRSGGSFDNCARFANSSETNAAPTPAPPGSSTPAALRSARNTFFNLSLNEATDEAKGNSFHSFTE